MTRMLIDRAWPNIPSEVRQFYEKSGDKENTSTD